MCRNRELLVGPEGSVFKCHRDLYHNELPIGNILSPEDIELYKFRECHHYGKCNPCDIKQKTNRFLQTGNCQVEIKPLNE
jgi:radical SAM protein with 4Fe4S-binding SPASM domain